MSKSLLSKICSFFTYQSNEKLKIYVVDDVENYAKLVSINLEEAGYSDVELFYNGEDVVSKLKDESPDCIILDHILSEYGLNGGDVLNYTRINNPRVKTIILSGQENLEVASKVIKQGAYDYIIKNDMAFFNLSNVLSSLEVSINVKRKSDWVTKRNKLLYTITIILIWVIALLFIF